MQHAEGINWDQSKLGRYPDRKDLDSLQLQKPVQQYYHTYTYIHTYHVYIYKKVFLWRACLHIGVANTLALSVAGFIDSSVSSSSERNEKLLVDAVPGGKPSINLT